MIAAVIMVLIGLDVSHHMKTWSFNQSGVPLNPGCHWRVDSKHHGLPLVDALDRADREHVLCYAPAAMAELRSN